VRTPPGSRGGRGRLDQGEGSSAAGLAPRSLGGPRAESAHRKCCLDPRPWGGGGGGRLQAGAASASLPAPHDCSLLQPGPPPSGFRCVGFPGAPAHIGCLISLSAKGKWRAGVFFFFF
jgi:hypothetical protein